MDNQKEVLNKFNNVYNKCFADKNALYNSQSKLELLQSLKLLEKQLRDLSLISFNEELKEIEPEIRKIILLPYIIAFISGQVSEDRLEHVSLSKKYYMDFLSLISHYQLIQNAPLKIYKALLKDEQITIEREDKIQLYQQEKQLKEDIKILERDSLEYFEKELQLYSILSINSIILSVQEIKMLEYKQELERDPDLKMKYEKEKKDYRPPKITFQKIDNTPKTDQQLLQQYYQDISKMDNTQTYQLKQMSLQKHVINNLLDQGFSLTKPNNWEELKKDIFKAHIEAPKMTLEEHSNLEYALMMQKQEQNKQREINKKEFNEYNGIKDENDSDEEAVQELKRIQQSKWDDWKDENAKGEGNRKK